MRTPSSDPSIPFMSDTSHFSTPHLNQSESIDYSSLRLDDADIDRALARYQTTQRLSGSSGKSSGSAGPAWISIRKGRASVSRRAVLVGLLGVVGVLAVLQRAFAAEGGGVAEYSDSLRDWAPWSSSQSASPSQRPIRKSKYAGGRKFPAQAFPALPVLDVLNHASPRATFREQLKTGVRYVTTMAYGGHANQFISIQKMLYMAKQTSRVGLIPTLIPIHIDGPALPMSSFYDIDRFNSDAAVPALEFSQLKAIDLDSSRPHDERVSCWSIQELAVGHANAGAFSFDVHDVWVDHWALPPMSRGMGGQDVAFDALRMFDFDGWARQQWVDKARREFLPQMPVPADATTPLPHGEANLKPSFDPVGTAPPDDQLLCYDNTLFIGSVMFAEPYPSAVPLEDSVPGEDLSWIEVGRHLRFNRALERLADEYLVELFGCGEPSRIPPFISIHLRRGDFAEFTGFTDLDKYISGLTRVRARLQARLDNPYSQRGVFLENFRHFGRRADEYEVVVTTDEPSGTPFWHEVEKMGWRIVDHDKAQTKERLGPWHMTMLDSAILARGQSFVGTGHSTFSHLAGLRVKYWNGGLVDGAF